MGLRRLTQDMMYRNQSKAPRYKVRATGFTLLELLVVILIIGLLTGIVGPRFLGQIGRSEVTAAKAQLDAFDKALQAYRIDTGRFPTTAQGLQALLVAPGDEPRWRGPYLKGQIPLDPWGRPFQYRSPGSPGKDFDLQSLGKDGAAGGTGDDIDLII
jgi:general secretion pathway protein G